MTSKPPQDPSDRPRRKPITRPSDCLIPPPAITEADVQAYRLGDAMALRRLMSSLVYELEKWALPQVQDRDDAWDAIKDTYMRLAQNHAQFEGDAEAFRAWARSTTTQAVQNLHRTRARERRRLVADGEDHEPAPETTTDEIPLSQDPEARAFLQKHIHLLDDAHRRVIELCLDDRSHAEIAAILTEEEALAGHRVVVTEEAVRKRKKHVFTRLGNILRKRFQVRGAPAPLDLETLLDMTYATLVHDEVGEALTHLRWQVKELKDQVGFQTWRADDLERRWQSDVARLEKERDEALARAEAAVRREDAG